MPVWQLIKTPRLSGPANMEYDLELFQAFEKGIIPPTLRIYSWEPRCISLGYSQKIEKEISISRASALGWDVVRRPTGGGIVFHNSAEVTYALVTALDDPLLPKGLIASYKKISEAVVFALSLLGVKAEISKSKIESPSTSCLPAGTALGASRKSETGLCFSYPAEYEIVIDDKKIVGSAQKRGKRTLLQQGSVFMRRNDGKSFSILKQPGEEINAVSVEELLGREVSFEELSEALVKGFEEVLNVEFNEK